MKSLLLLLALFLSPQLAPTTRAEDPAPKKGDAKQETPVYDEKAIGSEQIAAALIRAKRENRRVLIQWGANWCGWCTMLADIQRKDSAIAKKILYEYDVVKIDVGRFDKHMDLAETYGADLKKNGLPFLTVLDGDGKPIANQETSSLESKDETKKGHDAAKVLAFLEANQAKYLEAQALYDAAFVRAKAEGKRVFLHFGAPWCGWCHRLEDWMDRPDVHELLSKEFVDLKIDTDRTVGGQAMLERMRGSKEGGIPWFVTLDADGKPLANSGDAKTNIGFPAAPDEIERFRALLVKSCTKLTPDEITKVIETLAPKKPSAR